MDLVKALPALVGVEELVVEEEEPVLDFLARPAPLEHVPFSEENTVSVVEQGHSPLDTARHRLEIFALSRVVHRRCDERVASRVKICVDKS